MRAGADVEAREGFVLDLVIEDLPPPGGGDLEEVFPEALRKAWGAVELDVPDDEDGPRRAWTVSDPESDLELTVVWAKAPDEEVQGEEVEREGEASSPAEEAAEAEAEAQGGGLLFGHRPRTSSRGEDLLRVFELGLRLAERLGKRILDPVLGETFEAEDWAWRITEPFRARGFLATHWVRAEERPGDDWLHTHGMERFGLPDLEAFSVPAEDEGGELVLAYLLDLAEAWVREDAPAPLARVRRLEGAKVRVVEPREARARQTAWDESELGDHDGPRLAVEPADGDWKSTLGSWRPSNVQVREPGLVKRLCALTGEILPEVRERFSKGGVQAKVKARFPVGPLAAGDDKPDDSFESMWVHVEEWDDERIRGRLANDPERRRDLACGVKVEVRPAEVWDVLVLEDGRAYRGVALRRWLRTG